MRILVLSESRWNEGFQPLQSKFIKLTKTMRPNTATSANAYWLFGHLIRQ